LTIPNTVTTIGSYAFRNLDVLTTVEIPSSVASIGQKAFQNCNLLNTINCNVNKSIIDNATDIFLGTASPLTINVPVGTSGWVAGSGLNIGGNENVTVNII